MQKAAQWTTTNEYVPAEDKEKKEIETNQEEGTVASDTEQGQGRTLLRENSKIQRSRHSGTGEEHHGCKQIGKSVGVFVALTTVLVVFILVQGEVQQESPSSNVDVIGSEPEPQCNLPCAISPQRSIAELVLGHDICPCVTIESSSSSSSGDDAGVAADDTGVNVNSSPCDCSPEERALQWMVEEDVHFSYNEVADGVSKTFLMVSCCKNQYCLLS